MTSKEIESLSSLIKDSIVKKYQNLYLDETKRQNLNQLISNGTSLAYVLDNYQAGFQI